VADIARILLVAAASLYALIALTALFFSDAMLFPMQPRNYSIPDLLRLPASDGAEIAALHLRNPNARWTLLHSHGNGEDLESLLPLLEQYRRRGYSVLAYDYPGYGLSSGRPSESGAYAAIDACYRYLTQQQGLAPERIILYGRSLGSGPAVDLAARRPAAALILESGFVSAFRVMTRIRLLPWDKFENESKLPKVEPPVFVMQAANDGVVGYWHGPRLYAAANQPKLFWRVENAGHNDLIFAAGEQYWSRLAAFTDALAGPLSAGGLQTANPAALAP
jgi:hypothetical protein